MGLVKVNLHSTLRAAMINTSNMKVITMSQARFTESQALPLTREKFMILDKAIGSYD